MMRLTQGTFSFLPDLSDDEIESQVRYALSKGWPISVEFTDDPHPRNTYWDMWGLPMFDQQDPAQVMVALEECRKTYPGHYIRMVAYDRSAGRQTVALSFIAHRPPNEPGFRLERQAGADRRLTYRLHSYATDRPAGERYGA
ncbi:ribulose bisphosphate carboxylase small subunit [Azospirillum sp. ST 5-10]|uniref:ribulose bisphosphate carboxylase small subunit n=1 Tax=unclassified Azospirillum TaxID=2630922 RepID=UPI003F4A3637